MSTPSATNPKDVLEEFRLVDNIYLLGTFERNLTIYDQQVRALNFVWSLIEPDPKKAPKNVAVIGGGFAGLTAAAGLLTKGVGRITIFEKRATLLPLQQGSDARWIHPHIYEWPNPGSELPTAALPLLNWNAGRASDVVVQVLAEWSKLLEGISKINAETKVDRFVNIKHLRLAPDQEIEWIGEKLPDRASVGNKAKFDCVVIAVGFGLELNAPFSYWRNETLGQPELGLGKRTYLVSGYGDGALIDLFRIRISQFRQDRILVDLFDERPKLRNALQELKHNLDSNANKAANLYDEFEQLAGSHPKDFEDLLKLLRRRLRADTTAVLRMSKDIDRFEKVFSGPASFQNRFLLFLLYRAGGVIPSVHKDTDEICMEYGIDEKNNVICRHGTNRGKVLGEILDKTLAEKTQKRIEELTERRKQPNKICWKGGDWNLYWNDPSKKKFWRKEHLPAATEIMATAFITGVAGYLEAAGAGDDFRVTLHRIIHVGGETLLQQSSRYIGTTTRLKEPRTGDPARTFKLEDGTIGYAVRTAKILRTRLMTEDETEDQYKEKLRRDSEALAVEKDSQTMSKNVRSVLALPILAPDHKTVLAVLFADSTKLNVFIDQCVGTISQMCRNFAEQIQAIRSERVRNFFVSPPSKLEHAAIGSIQLEVIEPVDQELPIATEAKYLNIEFTDFISTSESSANG